MSSVFKKRRKLSNIQEEKNSNNILIALCYEIHYDEVFDALNCILLQLFLFSLNDNKLLKSEHICTSFTVAYIVLLIQETFNESRIFNLFCTNFYLKDLSEETKKGI